MTRTRLRTRVTASFTVGALVLAAAMALASYQMARGTLLAERERTALRAASRNAMVVSTGLAAADPNILEILRSLNTGGDRQSVLRRDGAWYARSADTGVTSAIPTALRTLVEQGHTAVQRVRVDGRPMVVVGVPLSGSTAFYSVDSLQELDRTLQLLALVLTAVAAAVGLGGAGLGWYAGRSVLRPLDSVVRAAREIAAGDLGTRLAPVTEPDLATLTTSFNTMVDQLAERLERDRRFAADVSHELRSPLQTLSAAASILDRRRGLLDERAAAAAGLVVDEIGRFQTLVNDLIELARDDQPVDRSDVDVDELARQLCRERGLPGGLVHCLDGAPVRWRVDRRRLRHLLGNLLDNAVRHGGGPCAVRLGRSATGCFIEVDDEGPGVAPEDREIIFSRFVRGRLASARGGGDGTGLGLALVARYAAAHGGRAVVLDRPGGGARFRVELAGCRE